MFLVIADITLMVDALVVWLEILIVIRQKKNQEIF
jgi:hypothetical protein